MKYDPISRRHFLQGLGGSLLSLPVLPSLIPKAHAQLVPNPKFLVMIGSSHGGTGYNSDWYPRPVLDNIGSNLLTVRNLFGSQPSDEVIHQYREGLLNQLLTADPGHAGGNVDNGADRVSFILGQFLNPVISKMNFLRGIDLGTFYSGHHRAFWSGNVQAAVNNSSARDSMENWPSLDQFLIFSKKFYGINEPISTPAILYGGRTYLPDGSTTSSTGNNMSSIYDAIYKKYENDTSPAVVAERNRKNLLLDKVLGDYQRITRGAYGPARQISSEDKVKVEQHASFLHDLQKKFQSIINSCSDVSKPNNANDLWFTRNRLPNGFNDLPMVYDVATDLMVAAFQCGASRIGMIDGGVKSDVGDYHQSIAHQADNSANARLVHNQNFRWQAEHIVGTLVNKMDSFQVGSTNQTILDKSLVLWTHECGFTTHHHHSLGCVSFGSLDGFFQTGKYLDYRNHANLGLLRNSPTSPARPGVPIQRLWANIVRGMGFSPSEFERNGRPGYGDSTINSYPSGNSRYHMNHKAYPASMMNSLSDLLPGLTS